MNQDKLNQRWKDREDDRIQKMRDKEDRKMKENFLASMVQDEEEAIMKTPYVCDKDRQAEKEYERLRKYANGRRYSE